MSRFIFISGSLLCDSEQVSFIKEILPLTVAVASDYQLTHEEAVLYLEGWSFPEPRVNWGSFVFFGGSMKNNGVDYLLYQICYCAEELKKSGLEEKGLEGCFYLMDEEVDRFLWEIREDKLCIYKINDVSGNSEFRLVQSIQL